MIWVLAIAVGLVVAWRADVAWHPWKPCPACGGGTKNRGSRPEAWGYCGRCGKSGKVRRFGAGRES